MKIQTILIWLVILVSVVAGFYLYPQMPDQMASHWNTQGEVDGYLPKFWGLFLMPLITFVIATTFKLVPKIDPLKENIEKFRKYYENFILTIVLFLLYIHTLSIVWNLGIEFNIGRFIIPAVGIVIFCAGILIKNSKRNWIIGIRTPWTLSSDVVWDKTHKIGGKMFMGAGVIVLLGIFFEDYLLYFLLIPVIFVALFSLVYSFVQFRKEKLAGGKYEI